MLIPLPDDNKSIGSDDSDWESISYSSSVDSTPTADSNSDVNDDNDSNWETVGKSDNEDDYNIEDLGLEEDEIK